MPVHGEVPPRASVPSKNHREANQLAAAITPTAHPFRQSVRINNPRAAPPTPKDTKITAAFALIVRISQASSKSKKTPVASFQPDTRVSEINAAVPAIMPTAIEKPGITSPGIGRTVRIAEAYAPIPKKAACPKDICPA